MNILNFVSQNVQEDIPN